jgi:hypothetical protein
MIYVSFDTNIWIYSLDESWKLDNLLDYIEYWQDNQIIEVVMPEIILDEWKRHQEKEVLHRKNKLRSLVASLNQFIPKSYLLELNEESTQIRLIDEQLNRIEQILSKSTNVPLSQEVKDRVLEDGIKKIAPQHKKSSVADAIILHSFLAYIETVQSPLNAFYFISDNKEDFADSRSKIHADLVDIFNSLNVEFFRELSSFIGKVKSNNKDINLAISDKRELRIQNRLQKITYNPEYDSLVQDQESSVIANKETIDFILSKSKPTREQAIFILALIDSDSVYEEYFYRKVNSEYWLQILNRKKVFHPDNSKRLFFEKEGVVNTNKSYWYPISYIDKISSNSLTKESVDLIIKILLEISAVENDNFITWRHVIEAVSKIPNEKIPLKLINYSHNWIGQGIQGFSSNSTYFVFHFLLPKFLNENSTPKDIEKAQILLFNSIAIEKNKHENLNEGDSQWVIKTDVHSIDYESIDKDLLKRIAINSSTDFVKYLSEIVRRLALDYLSGVNINFYNDSKKEGVRYFNFKINFRQGEDDDLIIYELIGETSVEYKHKYILEKYTSIPYQNFKSKLISTLKINTDVPQNHKNLGHLEWRLFYGKLRAFSAISEFIEDEKNSQNPLDIFPIFFVKLLEERVKGKVNDTEEILSFLFNAGSQSLAFNRKVGFHLLKFCWKAQKHIFWEEFTSHNLFLNHNESIDVRELLDFNQNLITKKESLLLNKVIEEGPPIKEIRDGTDDKEYWQFKWLSALRKNKYFIEQYQITSEQLDIGSDHFNKNPRISYWGDLSPLSTKELCNLNIRELADYLKKYKSDGGFRSPNESGLAEVFKAAIKENPKQFIKEIDLLSDIPIRYYKSLLYGVQEYWNNSLQQKKVDESQPKEVDWQIMFVYCLNYLRNFLGDSENIRGDEENDDQEVIRATTSLISSALSYNSSLTNSALNSSKNLIQFIFQKSAGLADRNIHEDFDYPTYVINSITGSILLASLEYSLHRVRTNDSLKESDRWESEIKEVFEETFKQSPFDFYIIFGWHFWQLHYLDSRWTLEKAESLTGVSRTNLIAFMSGFVLSRAPNTKPLLSLFYPLYKEVISQNLQIKYLQGSHVSKHIGTFYLWGFEELTDEDSLIYLLLKTNDLEYISKLISFLNKESEYPKKLPSIELGELRLRILDLWQLIWDNLKDTEEDKDKEILKRSLRLISYFSMLGNDLKSILKAIVGSVELNISKDILIGDLKNLFFEDDKILHAQSEYHNLGELLLTIPFKDSYIRLYENNLLFLTELLYKNECTSLANAYCEKMSADGFEFLNKLYSKYNS